MKTIFKYRRLSIYLYPDIRFSYCEPCPNIRPYEYIINIAWFCISWKV